MNYKHFLDHTYSLSERSIDPVNGHVSYKNQSHNIRRKELEILALLASADGQIVRRAEFIDKLWNGNTAVGDTGLTKAIASLRKAIFDEEKAHRIIRTIPRQGYQLSVSVELESAEELNEVIFNKLIDNRWTLKKKINESKRFVDWLAFDEKESISVIVRLFKKGNRTKILENEIELVNGLKNKLPDHFDKFILPTDWNLKGSDDYFVYQNNGFQTIEKWLETKVNFEIFNLETRLVLLQELADTLQLLHKQNIVHKKITPNSIYIKKLGNKVSLKLGGLSALTVEQQNNFDSSSQPINVISYNSYGEYIQTQYIAPEVSKGHSPDVLSDVFSYGILAKKLIKFKPIIRNSKSIETQSSFKNLKDLIDQCHATNPVARPSLLDIQNEISGIIHSRQLRTIVASDAGFDLIDDKLPKINGYRILETLGKGGMGIVYLAEQEKPITRLVAIKLINVSQDHDGEIRKRFESEIQALGIINHPNIANVYEVGKTNNGQNFVAMEYVPGFMITRFADEKKLDINARVKLFMQVCDAITHCHQKGLIHRDINPSNLLISSKDQKEPIAKLIDFGLVKSIQIKLTDNSPHTQIGRFLGTKKYSSPEQIIGNKEFIDARSDIYSLGVLLYEILTGKLPFEDGVYLNKTPPELFDHIKLNGIKKPESRLSAVPDEEFKDILVNRSVHRGEKLISEVKNELSWIVFRCLEFVPEQRYNAVSELKDDLNNWLLSRPVNARKTNTIYYFKKFIARNKSIALITVTSVAALIASTSVATYSYINAKEALREVENIAIFQQKQLQLIEPELLGKSVNDQITERSKETFESLDLDEHEKRVVDRVLSKINFTDVARSQLKDSFFDPSIVAIEKSFSDNKEVQYKLLLALAETAIQKELIAIYDTLLDKLIDLTQSTYGVNHPNSSLVKTMRSYRLQENGDSDAAIKMATNALKNLTSTLGNDDIRTMKAQKNLGGIYSLRSEFELSNKHLSLALEGFKDKLGGGDSLTLATELMLAVNFTRMGEHDKASALFIKTVDEAVSSLGIDHHFTLLAKRQLATFYFHSGDYENSVKMADQSLDSYEKKYGLEHNIVLGLLNIKSGALDMMNKNKKAEGVIRKAISIATKRFGSQHSTTLIYKQNLGIILQKQYRFGEAKELIENTLAANLSTFGKNNFNTILYLLSQGELYFDMGLFLKSKNILEDTHLTAVDFLGDDHYITMNILHSLNEARLELGFFQDVINSITSEAQADNHKQEILLARAYSGLNQFSTGKAHFVDAIRLAEGLGGYDVSKYTYMAYYGHWLSQNGFFADADSYLSEATNELKANLGADKLETVMAMSFYANHLNTSGQTKRAKEIYHDSLSIAQSILSKEHTVVKNMAKNVENFKN